MRTRPRIETRTEHAEPRCQYCQGSHTMTFFEYVTLDAHYNPVKHIDRVITQREHDRACPAARAPLGTALAANDMTAEIIADARRQRRPIHERVR